MFFDPYEPVPNISSHDLAIRVTLPSPEKLPRLVLTVSPSRSGSTAMLRVFSALNIPSYYQPLKTILRSLMQGEEGGFTFPEEAVLFIKEAIGPFTHSEASLDPLAILLEAGYPPHLIYVITQLREPLSTLTSWFEKYSPYREKDILFHNFLTAYQGVWNTRVKAQALGILTVPYVYEAQRDQDPAVALQQLCSQIGVSYADSAVNGWESDIQFNTPGSLIHYPAESALFAVRNLHTVVKSSTQLGYTVKSPAAIDQQINLEQLNILIAAGIPKIYEQMRIAVERELQLQVIPSHEIEAFIQRH